MAEPFELELFDAKQEAHSYIITPHAGSEGARLCMRVLAIAGEPIGRIVGSKLGDLIGAFQGANIDLDSPLEGEFKKLADQLKDVEIDLGIVVRDVQTAIAALGDEAFFLTLLKYTYRDGKPVAKPSNFDQFYQANYVELFQILWHVIRVNGFLGSWGIS